MQNNPLKAIKEAIDYLQTPERLKENIELVGGLIRAQQAVLDIQDMLQHSNQKINKLETELEQAKALRKYDFAVGKNYLVDPDDPGRRFCPLCTKKNMTPIPLHGVDCLQCNGHYSR